MKLTPAQLRTLTRVVENGWVTVKPERVELLRGPGSSVMVAPDGHRNLCLYVLANGTVSADGRNSA